MTTLYVVTDGEYSDYTIKGIFSSPEKAEHAKEYWDARNDIEIYELDVVLDHPEGMFLWSVGMHKDGRIVISYGGAAVQRENSDHLTFVDEDRPYGFEDAMAFKMWARDEEHAIKIANERRLQHIANGTWEDDWSAWQRKKGIRK